MKKIVLMMALMGSLLLVSGCESEAEKGSYNLSQQADNFNVIRQLTVINCIEGNLVSDDRQDVGTLIRLTTSWK